MDLHELKSRLQNHFKDGLVVIVGSGLSCAEGMPGMQGLARHLIDTVGPQVESADSATWQSIADRIPSTGLEATLLETPPSPALERVIARETASLMLEHEQGVVTEVFNGTRQLRLTALLPYLVKPSSGLSIVTTNYDRLVEIAAEEAGLGVDTMFVGRFAGRLNEKESRLSFCRDVKLNGRRGVQYHYASRVNVFKPHGSLDWYQRMDRPVSYQGDLPGATRLIITPGNNKFRHGYESPFDTHRAKANDAIDKASRFLILGYGFNDDHLETHLQPAIRSGTPTLMLTRGLSEKAERIARSCPNVISLDAANENDQEGTRAVVNGDVVFLPSQNYWDLHSFIAEVLTP